MLYDPLALDRQRAAQDQIRREAERSAGRPVRARRAHRAVRTKRVAARVRAAVAAGLPSARPVACADC